MQEKDEKKQTIARLSQQLDYEGKNLLLEEDYVPFIKKKKALLSLYKKGKNWRLGNLDNSELSQFHAYLFPVEEMGKDGWSHPRLLSSQEAHERMKVLNGDDPCGRYCLVETAPGKNVVYSGAIFSIFLDHTHPMISRILKKALVYYTSSIPTAREEFFHAVRWSLLKSLTEKPQRSRLKYLAKVGYKKWGGDYRQHEYTFWIDVLHRFKEYFWIALGNPKTTFSENDNQFSDEFEREWKKALTFSELNYDFIIVPTFSHNDMARYARLLDKVPIKKRILHQMIDYVVLRICPSLLLTLNHIEKFRFQGWQALLLTLTERWMERIIDYQEEDKNSHLKEEEQKQLPFRFSEKERDGLLRSMEKRILELAVQEYNYLYKRQKRTIEEPGNLGIFPFGHLQELSTLPGVLRDGKYPSLSDNDRKGLIKKSSWVRPYYFLKQRLFEDFAPISDETGMAKGIVPRRTGSYIPLHKEDPVDFQNRGGKVRKIDINTPGYLSQVYEDPETGKKSYLVDGVAERIDRSRSTVQRMAEQGELPFVWKRIGKMNREVRLFPKEEIDCLPLLLRKKTLAKLLGITPRHLRRLKAQWRQTESKGESTVFTRFGEQVGFLKWLESSRKSKGGNMQQ